MNKSIVYGLVTISALLSTAITLIRKYQMKAMSNHSILFIDTVITGLIMAGASLYIGGVEQFTKDLTKFKGTVLLSFIGASICTLGAALIGYNLVRSQKLSYLVIVSTGVGVIATMLASYMFLGDKITKTKILSIPFLLTGVYLAR
uniref:EamA domain-containing protein n=1 Tax=viral metagenome TaxID=1070528 RepID=A0A6C0EMF9_9ZZZZ